MLLGTTRGGTVIGAMPLARSSLVPATVLAFAAQHPEHAVSILDGPYETLLEALRQGRADLLVGALRNPPPVSESVHISRWGARDFSPNNSPTLPLCAIDRSYEADLGYPA